MAKRKYATNYLIYKGKRAYSQFRGHVLAMSAAAAIRAAREQFGEPGLRAVRDRH